MLHRIILAKYSFESSLHIQQKLRYRITVYITVNKKKKRLSFIYSKKLHYISVLKRVLNSAHLRVIQLSNYYMSNLDIYNQLFKN